MISTNDLTVGDTYYQIRRGGVATNIENVKHVYSVPFEYHTTIDSALDSLNSKVKHNKEFTFKEFVIRKIKVDRVTKDGVVLYTFID